MAATDPTLVTSTALPSTATVVTVVTSSAAGADYVLQHMFGRPAFEASVIAFAILTGAALAGDWLLRTLSISLPAFRIAGGLLLFSIASEMVFGVRIARQSETAGKAVEEHVRNIAAFPLAIPLMAGPGAITATVLLSGRADGSMLRLGALIAIIAIVMTACLVVFWFATQVERLVGRTGNTVLSRLLGVLLAAMAVQFVVDGVRALLSS